MYLSTSTSTEDFPEMYLSTFQVLYKLYLSTDVLKYKVLLPGSERDPLCSSSRQSLNVCRLWPLPTLTVPGWSKVHDGDVEGVEQTGRGTPASPILVECNEPFL